MKSTSSFCRPSLFFVVGSLLFGLTGAGRAADPTFTAVPINTNGAPLGYWEFLPSAYYENPSQNFPVLIYFPPSSEPARKVTNRYLYIDTYI